MTGGGQHWKAVQYERIVCTEGDNLDQFKSTGLSRSYTESVHLHLSVHKRSLTPPPNPTHP